MKNLRLIILSCLMVLLAACGNKPASTEDKNSGSFEVKNEIPAEQAGVKAEWKLEDSDDQGKLLLKNGSEKTVGTGTAYKIEKWTDGKWEKVNADQMFTEQMIEVKAGGDYEQTVELKEKKAGTYRITKTFFEDEKKHDIAVVFDKK
ncbi:immunoglobulin-like domain-containing protein [Bacillus sp. NEB1478]|uniref:immunoglobulin-like domain-containing protein n=1 Tax=Bacillus sp. NEB1478 TaxID=3073816 RepID=UPI002872E3CB|nr:immunoglobulin-like domain-containing protein [Bacillus sp. NEB1478]WNB92250.1 hypothetical protein RGB74_00895 [Bacillus sp. NEB1478]